ncbi:hypothetical protein MP638_001569, partial [Amoeboaphelidium occidentale]
KKRSTSGANYCLSSLTELSEENNELPELPDILEKFAKKHDRARIMRALRTVHRILVAETVEKKLSLEKEFLKEYWYKFFYLQYHILEHFTKYSEADAQARLEENRRGKGLRLFTMVPLADIKTSHAFFDSSGLSEVVHMAFEDESFVAPPNHPRNLNVTSRKALFTGKKSRVPLWNWAVKVECVKHKNLDFNYSFSTDGERINDKGFLWSNQMKYSPIGIENRVVVGVDPGRIDLVVCSDGSRKSFGCSGKEWQEIAGFRYQRWRQKSWLEKNDNIQTIVKDMPSAKVTKVEDYLTYLNYILRHYTALSEFYGSQKWRQLRRKTDMKKTKAFD